MKEGDIIHFNATISFGDVEITNTFSKVYSEQVPVFKDLFQKESKSWDLDFWGRTDEDAYSGVFSFTDSPYTDYFSSLDNELTLNYEIDLTAPSVKDAYLSFFAKWDIEDNFDFLQVIASYKGTETALC